MIETKDEFIVSQILKKRRTNLVGRVVRNLILTSDGVVVNPNIILLDRTSSEEPSKTLRETLHSRPVMIDKILDFTDLGETLAILPKKDLHSKLGLAEKKRNTQSRKEKHRKRKAKLKQDSKQTRPARRNTDKD